ncbi:MAG: hypothetical protein IT303_18855 [Dehalococcoidia bacterium]|nr:hypothetical protein [Dehalococcoidia bacterium]
MGRFALGTVVAVAALVLAALGALGPAGPAQACSISGFYHGLQYTAERSDVIAVVGTFEGPGRDGRLALRVTEGLRGAAPGDLLDVNNLELELGAGCEVYVGDRRVERYSAGETVFAYLEKDETGVAEWRPAHYGWAIAAVDAAGRLVPGRTAFEPGVELVEALEQVTLAAAAPYDAGLELVRPCRAPWTLPETLALAGAHSQAVVIGTLQPGGSGMAAQLAVEQVLKGDPGEAPTLNIAHIRQDYEETCQTLLGEGPPRLEPGGQRVLAFLVPDEFGFAQWRPAGWGTGLLFVDAGMVSGYERYPTLQYMRELVGAPPPPPPASEDSPTAAATADPTPTVQQRPPVTSPAMEDDDDRALVFGAAGGVAAGALAIAALGLWLRRRAR